MDSPDVKTELSNESVESPHARSLPGADQMQDLYVVCLGASAGGLEALEGFFDNMPTDSGAAFVVVQHLSPDFKSLMDELLARHTDLRILRVEDGMLIEPYSIYLIPPKKEMIVSGGKLLLTDRDPALGLSLPIDTFMRSLAQEYGQRAVGVILAGTGSDGSRGIRAIHDAGGFVIVQDEDSANFNGMPKSAIHTGVVDAVLPPPRMGAVILDHVRGRRTADYRDDGIPPMSDDGIGDIFRNLNEVYGTDFSYYKPSTVARRLERRLQLSRLPDLKSYVQHVREDAEELNALYRDLLIGVTKFIRDQKAFERLQRDVFPGIINQVSERDEIRVWVAGCATGEEAYSVAILMHEALSERGRPIHVRIFATDVHQASLNHASAGIYRAEALSDVSPRRLERHFGKHGGGYQISADLRKMIVFAPHNVVKDASFTKLDLVCCRNLLIYLMPPVQKKAISLFHFALKAGGFLFLSPSESPGELADEFDTVDRRWKVFRKRRDVRLSPNIRLPLSQGFGRLREVDEKPTAHSRALVEPQLLRATEALLADYAPPSILVDRKRRFLHSFAGGGRFLSVPDGRPPQDILEYVDSDLRLAMSGALQRAAKEKLPVVYGSIKVRSLPVGEQVRLRVKPLATQDAREEYYLISFESQVREPHDSASVDEVDIDQAAHDRMQQLDDELRYTKENLQASIEELETTNEELQATNEEFVASNEELQSTNEELHSVNEELYTVNAEHQRKITELTELTDHMDNLLRSTDVGTIFLDRELRIRKFTPQISHAFEVLPQDVGRPINVFAHSLLHETLLSDLRRVLHSEERIEKDVQDRHGNWLLLRLLPYRSQDRVDGVVITLIDISRCKLIEDELRRMSKVFMDGADPIVIEDLEGKIVDVNTETEEAYGWKRDELLGQNVTLLVPPECAEQARELRARCRNQERVRNVESARLDRDGRVHPILLTLSLLTGEEGRPMGIATISKDIQAQKDAEREARDAARKRDEFLAMLSHELRNSLGAVLNATEVVAHENAEHDAVTRGCQVLRRQARQMARLLDDLMDVARVTQGRIEIRSEVLNLVELVDHAIEAVRPQLDQRAHQLDTELPNAPLFVEGDRSRLLQIQENLLINAARYSPAGSHIRLKLTKEVDETVITISDDGQGIPAEMLDSIFDLFVQGERTLARDHGGMGVGLSLVQMLVNLHGGRVTAQSEGLGKGSTFQVRLPTTEKRLIKSQPLAAAPARGARVVVIEDNHDSRTMISELLRLDGYDSIAAADGIAGYQAIAQQRPDVALIDIGLPGMDGYDVARKVRSELRDGDIRLVALTGYGRTEDRQAVMEAGFDEHLVKPVDPEDLTRVLRRPK